MKNFLVGMMGIGACVGLLAAIPVTYAEEPAVQLSEEETYARKVHEFHVVLFGSPGATIYEEGTDGDAVYQKAHEAAETYLSKYGDDGSAELTKLLEARREVALSLYTQHFGPWQRTPAEFDEFFSKSQETPVQHCRKNAVAACGREKVCWVNTGPNSCLYACQDGNGNCPAIPTGH